MAQVNYGPIIMRILSGGPAMIACFQSFPMQGAIFPSMTQGQLGLLQRLQGHKDQPQKLIKKKTQDNYSVHDQGLLP